MGREELEKGDERAEEEERRQHKFELRRTVPYNSDEHLFIFKIRVSNSIFILHHFYVQRSARRKRTEGCYTHRLSLQEKEKNIMRSI